MDEFISKTNMNLKFIKGLVLFYIKLFISSLNFNYSFLKKIKIARHGAMDDIFFALKIFSKHIRYFNYKKNGTILEIGPGDSRITYDISKSLGFEKVYLVDKGVYFSPEQKNNYQNQIKKHFEKLILKNKIKINSNCKLHYFTNGLKSIQTIPESSVDFLFSNSVLQHISLDEIDLYVKELSRVTKKNSIQSHRIDLKDMIDQSINHLRFSKSFWESKKIKDCYFYTNRLRHIDFIKIFKKYNFIIIDKKVNKFESLLFNKNNLSPIFRKYDFNEIKISGFSIVLKNNK